MISLLLAAAAAQMTSVDAPAQSAVDAERAFAADAQEIGQWTAFRKWSTADAVLFAPHPVNAHELLKDSPDPPVSVFWWPGRSYVSCDNMYAVNTGPWVREWGKSVGYFTTVWQRQPDGGWKWVYDGGASLETPRAEGGDIQPVKAACAAGAPIPPPPQAEVAADVKSGRGSSADSTLNWFWAVEPSGKRTFTASIWDGREHRVVVRDEIAAPPQ